MSAGAVIVVLLIGLLITVALWAAILDETSNATVMDRAEAERFARERGGRGPKQSQSRSSETGADAKDGRNDGYGWTDEPSEDDRR
ncbi:hypothetical protein CHINAEXTREME_06535 [Halobiforma lacisalsi AJ5]|uniref:Uncharacterized protein n=1 Tax=Natronobacterium lacisalsi AJ5 TaxID=358396 RepID=M0M0U5_NATLA|nr:hypothetical protein [Halobiforma lacisalsi]APW97447.1 hypothetical protein CHINAEXTREME_06535 [Halobiforma lacisalsi AJ5]EMA38254.1 hypothetical protein C445_00095 [Halobiforma lacisalsi AJ5]